jgi:hypothetical protein
MMEVLTMDLTMLKKVKKRAKVTMMTSIRKIDYSMQNVETEMMEMELM